MADSNVLLEQITTGQAQKEVTANQLFDAMSAAASYGRHAETCAGLVWGYYGTRFGGTAVANGTNTCGTSITTYMVAHLTTGAVTFATTTTNWDTPATYGRCFKIVTGASAVVSYEDHRFGPLGIINAAAVAGSGDMILASVQTVTGAKTFGSAGAVGKLKIAGTTSGTIILDAEAVAGTNTLTLPAATDTLVGKATTDTLTNKTLTSPVLTAPVLGTPASGTLTNATGLPVAGGGTGVATLTAYAPVFGGTTGTAAVQSGTAGTSGHVLTSNGAGVLPTFQAAGAPATTPVLIQIACSDEATALTTGTKVTFRTPYAFTLTAVRGSLTTAATGATLFAFDLKESGTTVFSTKPTLDASEKTTTTAATASVISDSAIADDAEMTIIVDAVGSTIAGAGLKVALIGTKP